MESGSTTPKRLNVLVLDGGGVRGVSSLLILQALMAQINLRLEKTFGKLYPHDVFQLVAGTSTGGRSLPSNARLLGHVLGLIALMLGKMGLTVDECITQYEKLSKIIFGKKHIRGTMTRGLGPAKYSGKRLRNCVRDLLQDRGFDQDLGMRHEDKSDKIACAVICREYWTSSQYSKLKHSAVPICSLPCKSNFDCTVCDAARATSAAPTFFSVMKIRNRFFADGGLKHNNPSFAMYFHYTQSERKKSTRRMLVSQHSAPQFSAHGDLDCSRVRFTNIGTGAKKDEVEPGKREWLAALVPGPIRKGVFLKQTLTEIAVDAEEKADTMRQFEELNPNTFMYERFDASHGVSNIKLDNYRALDDIKRRTRLYLDEQETKDMLEEVGEAIAQDYRANRPDISQNTQGSHLTSADTALQIPSSIPAEPSMSDGPSSNSNDAESGSQDLSLDHAEVPVLLNGHVADILSQPDLQTIPKVLTPEDSGVGEMGSQLSVKVLDPSGTHSFASQPSIAVT